MSNSVKTSVVVNNCKISENNFTINYSVITGLELHKENGVVCIHAQQGKLLPGGHINDSSLEWIRVLPGN